MVAIDRSLLDEVVTLVRAAGDLTLQWFRDDGLAVERKGDGTPVTAADKAAERFLREELGRRFPDDAVIGEEEAYSAGSSGRTWVIDPIDGTKSFTHGVPLYSNLLALYDELGARDRCDQPSRPGRDRLRRHADLGCFANGRPAHVNDTSSLDGACVCTSGLGSWTARAARRHPRRRFAVPDMG